MKNSVLVVAALALIILCGCTTSLENKAPVLEDVVTDVSIRKGENITLTLEHVDAYDDNGDVLDLVILSGANYTVSGTVITPDSNFVGDLYIAIYVSDGEYNSATKIIIISVVDDVELFPLIPGSWWSYRDSIIGDSTMQSKLEVVKEESVNLNGSDISIATLSWSHLSNDTAFFLMGNDSLGVYSYGGTSPQDSLDSLQLFLSYPATMGSSWQYNPVKFNASDKKFFMDTEVTITCVDTAKYITVPAGIFKCLIYSFSYTLRSNRSTVQEVGLTGIKNRSMRTNTIEEKVYYSPGVGYIKNETSTNGTVTWVKELMDYKVEQSTGAF